MTPDPDQISVYFSEEVAFAGTPCSVPLRPDDLFDLADQLFTTGWWDRLKIPVPIVEVDDDRISSSAEFYYNAKINPVIKLAGHHISPAILAHEAAHIAQFYFYPSDRRPDIEDHGREFRACYLRVAEILLGAQAAHELKTNFDRRLPVRPEHQPGQPGWILTVPRIRPVDRIDDPDGVGIFPAWRKEQQDKIVTTVQQRLDAANPPSSHHVGEPVAL